MQRQYIILSVSGFVVMLTSIFGTVFLGIAIPETNALEIALKATSTVGLFCLSVGGLMCWLIGAAGWWDTRNDDYE